VPRKLGTPAPVMPYASITLRLRTNGSLTLKGKECIAHGSSRRMTLLTTKRLRGIAGIRDHSIRKSCCGTSYAIWRVSIAVACFMSSMVIHSPGQRWWIE